MKMILVLFLLKFWLQHDHHDHHEYHDHLITMSTMTMIIIVTMATMMTRATMRKLEVIGGGWRLYTRKLEVVWSHNGESVPYQCRYRAALAAKKGHRIGFFPLYTPVKIEAILDCLMRLRTSALKCTLILDLSHRPVQDNWLFRDFSWKWMFHWK